MNKPGLLAAASIVALCAGSTLAAGKSGGLFHGTVDSLLRPGKMKVLYNQNSNNTASYVASDNYTSGELTSYDNQAADDFVVPKGKSWKIEEVDVTGAYGSGSGPATSENVIFYKNRFGVPGKPVGKGTFVGLQGSGDHGNFAIKLPAKGVALPSGRYWVSVVANVDFDKGAWSWEPTSVQHQNQAMWQNPDEGFGRCQAWGTTEDCLGALGPDLMFALKGTSRNR